MNESAASEPAPAAMRKSRFPGWHTDPDVPDLERFWNGAVWTEYTRPAEHARPAEQREESVITSSDNARADNARADNARADEAPADDPSVELPTDPASVVEAPADEPVAELPTDLLGPIDPALQALLDSLDNDHSRPAPIADAEPSDATTRGSMAGAKGPRAYSERWRPAQSR